MNFKRVVLCLIAALCTVSFPLMALAASEVPQTSDSDISYYYEEISHFGIEEFLTQTGLDFLGYIRQMSELFSLGEFPHYLPENTARYEKFSELHPEIYIGAIIAYVNADMDKEAYYEINPVPDPYFIGALANSNFKLPARWVPSDLANVGHGHMLREEAAEYFRAMRDAITEDGLRLQIISTFRSYETQRGTHRRAVQRFGLESADRQIARPGHSEHQMGLAADILHRGGYSLLTQAMFETTPQFEWLQENAHNFGYILRFPYEYTHIHRVIFEPWHWRFVGVDIATVMHEQGILVYEEFYGRYLASDVLKNVRDNLLGHASTVTLTRKELTYDVVSMKFGEDSYFLIGDIANVLVGTEAEIETYETLLVEQPEDGEVWLSMPIERVVELNRTGAETEAEPYTESDMEPYAYTETETTVSARIIGPLTFYRIEDLAQTLGFEFEVSENGAMTTLHAPELPVLPDEPDEPLLFTVEVPFIETDIAAYDHETEAIDNTTFDTALLITVFGTAGTAILGGTVLVIKLRQSRR
ncbi:MAG: M15 family metallopeptidase [Oscillospiraceae bacterium]|nr:M15 family metallopeptidase [Oscillospiraceae bacterium]